jgi:lysyl endopeptidase
MTGTPVADRRRMKFLWSSLLAVMLGCAAEAPPPVEEAEPGGGKNDVCVADNSEPAMCAKEIEPQIYEKARAVLRLKIAKGGWCTGWLVGDQGHVMTNHHCIASQAEAAGTTFEIMAEAPDCATECTTRGGCPGKLLSSGAMLVKASKDLDYALVKLATNPTAEYGYFQVRKEGAKVGEEIYIPQHPEGWAKRIAMMDEAKFATIIGETDKSCYGVGPNVQYRADTRAGASGSPVVGYFDNAVVALHHCAGCQKDGGNRGVPIEAIITDLGNLLPPSAFSDPTKAP